MSYTANVPISGQSLGVTLTPINANFGQIASVFALNHVPFNSINPIAGKHNFVEMPDQSAKPATIANECSLYSSGSNVFFRPQSQALNAGNTYQLTRDISAQFAQFGTNPGWTFLPGNLIMMYGTTAFIAGTGGTVTLPFSLTNIYSINVTALRGAASSIVITATTLNSFTFVFGTAAGSGYSIYWSVIGN